MALLNTPDTTPVVMSCEGCDSWCCLGEHIVFPDPGCRGRTEFPNTLYLRLYCPWYDQCFGYACQGWVPQYGCNKPWGYPDTIVIPLTWNGTWWEGVGHAKPHGNITEDTPYFGAFGDEPYCHHQITARVKLNDCVFDYEIEIELEDGSTCEVPLGNDVIPDGYTVPWYAFIRDPRNMDDPSLATLMCTDGGPPPVTYPRTISGSLGAALMVTDWSPLSAVTTTFSAGGDDGAFCAWPCHHLPSGCAYWGRAYWEMCLSESPDTVCDSDHTTGYYCVECNDGTKFEVDPSITDGNLRSPRILCLNHLCVKTITFYATPESSDRECDPPVISTCVKCNDGYAICYEGEPPDTPENLCSEFGGVLSINELYNCTDCTPLRRCVLCDDNTAFIYLPGVVSPFDLCADHGGVTSTTLFDPNDEESPCADRQWYCVACNDGSTEVVAQLINLSGACTDKGGVMQVVGGPYATEEEADEECDPIPICYSCNNNPTIGFTYYNTGDPTPAEYCDDGRGGVYVQHFLWPGEDLPPFSPCSLCVCDPELTLANTGGAGWSGPFGVTAPVGGVWDTSGPASWLGDDDLVAPGTYTWTYSITTTEDCTQVSGLVWADNYVEIFVNSETSPRFEGTMDSYSGGGDTFTIDLPGAGTFTLSFVVTNTTLSSSPIGLKVQWAACEVMGEERPSLQVPVRKSRVPHVQTGPGTELVRLTQAGGMVGILGCGGCMDMVQRMNRIGAEGCSKPEEQDRILYRLRGRAVAGRWGKRVKEGALPDLNLNPDDPAPGILAEAIRRAGLSR
jgi:hypothetical protein